MDVLAYSIEDFEAFVVKRLIANGKSAFKRAF